MSLALQLKRDSQIALYLQIAEQIKDRLDAFADNYLSNENGKNFTRLYNQLRNEKILGHIKQHITVDEKKVGLEEFKKIVKEHKH